VELGPFTSLFIFCNTTRPCLQSPGDHSAEFVSLDGYPLHVDASRRRVLVTKRLLRLARATAAFGYHAREGMAQLMQMDLTDPGPARTALGESTHYP
jgi:hypothetical protein